MDRDFDTTSQSTALTDVTTDTEDASRKKINKKIIFHGIQLRLKNEKAPFYSYIYARSPVTSRGSKLDWKMLTSESVEGDHVIYHQLQPGDSLGTLIARYKASHAVAIILINTNDDYELADEFKATLARKKEKYPVVIINSDDGKHLIECLTHHDEIGDIVVKIEPSDQLPVDQPNQSLNERVMAMQNVAVNRRSALRVSAMFKHGTKKLAVDLKEDVKNMMFAHNGPVCISEDQGIFQALMGLFYQYEQMVHVEKSPTTDGAVFRKLLKHMDDTFAKDFPFYIILAYRTQKKQHMYQCEELPLFIQACIDKYEKLPTDKLLSTLRGFQKHDDFKIMYEARVATNTVFSMLEDACIELMMLSYSIKNKNTGQGHLPSKYVQCRVLWISSALTYRVARGAMEVPSYWTDHLCKTALLSLDVDTLHDIEQGMILCDQLGLPEEYSFNIDRLAELVASDGYIRPFTQMVEFVKIFQSRFKSEEEFVIKFIKHPRLCFTACFRQSYEDTLGLLNPDHNFLQILKEGQTFLSTVLDMCKKKGWKGTDTDEELKQWLILLLEQVDVTSDAAVVQLEDFLSTGVGPVCKQYREFIKRQIICAIQNKFSSLPVEKFFKLYKTFFIWPTWFVEAYLQSYKFADHECICSPMWCNLFSVFVERYSEAQYHKTLLDFLKSVGDTYHAQGRAKSFVLDLLHLNVSKLFSEGVEKLPLQHGVDIPTSVMFSSFLCTYIQKCSIRDAILQDINLIWESIENENDFQSIILQVLQRELVPDAVALKGILSKPVQTILTRSLETICTKTEELSPKHKFCWGFVATCCNKICISEDIRWIADHFGVVEQLGRIYTAHCANKGLTGQDCILKEIVLPAQATNDERTYFKWVKEAQGVLNAWKSDYNQKQLGYEKICEYSRNYNFVNRMAVALSVLPLVISLPDVQKYQSEYLRNVEDLNMYLLHSIPGHTEIPSCTLLQILSKYGVTLPPSLLKDINHFVIFPDEEKTEIVETEPLEESSLQLSLSLQSYRKKVQPVMVRKIQLTKGVMLCQVKQMIQGLDQLLRPVLQHVDHTKVQYLDILAFFYHQSEIFDKYLKLQLLITQKKNVKQSASGKVVSSSILTLPTLASPSREKAVDIGVPVGDLQIAIQKTLDLIKDLLKGEVSYNNLVADGSLDLKTIDLDAEFDILKSFALFIGYETVNPEGLEGIKCMLQLFQFGGHIDTIGTVCHQYNLRGCTSDPSFIELMSLAKDLEANKASLTPRLAIEKMATFKRILCLQDRKGIKFLDIFDAVAESNAFYEFVVSDKGFVGEAGQSRFRQQYQLITTQLQHEEYDEAVYNHLYAAFLYITPFTDKDQSFSFLMEKVAKLNVLDGCKQLETINRNIHLIRLWFSRAEGDTLKNVAVELESILQQGYFKFSTISAKAVLKFPYSSRPPLMISDSTLEERESIKEMEWNEEQVRDFIRRLGFLDADEKIKGQFDSFLHSNQVAAKLLDVYIKLKELGHPEYMQKDIGLVLPCCISQEKADQRVAEANTLLSQWEKEVTQLRTEHEQLLYFSIPKLLQLHQLIIAPDPSTTKVVQEVSFLFQNEASMRQRLKEVVKGMLENTNKNKYREGRRGVATYLQVVGSFLSELFRSMDVTAQSPSRRRPPDGGSHQVAFTQSAHILHSCCGFTQKQLIYLIINIYGGIPESFEVFRCHPTTTEEELKLFLNPKRPTRHPYQYVILEVNNLQYQLQEILLKLHFEFRQNYPVSEMPCIHFVETAPSLLQEMPGILVRDHKGSGLSMKMDEARTACQHSALNPNDFSCIQLVYGAAGDGKTHHIAHQLEKCSRSLHITISETFSVPSVIKKLNSLPIDDKDCGIFFNFTLLSPGDSVDEAESNHYNELISKIGWFFFDLFILGYIEDPVSGASFRLPGGASWAVYIEVPTLSGNKHTPEDSLKQFYEQIPALGLLGTPHHIDPMVPYFVDDDVQLVCKYLKAYKNNGINRLYKESKWMKPKHVRYVKFSQDDDLKPEDCYALLKEYTPEHMKKNKILQKLFVKYMKRRCAFLDACPAFYMNSGASDYNAQTKTYNDTRELGSTLMETMLKEVSDFCDPIIREDWSLKPHHQLIYDFQDGGGSFGLMTLHPDQIPEKDKERFRKIGIKIPSMLDLYNRDYLDMTLSRALNVPLNNGHLTPIDDANYVLTLDFAVKMLNIHERAECRVPVVIEGETGVGKTALIEMMSKLWNYSILKVWNREKVRLVDFIKEKLKAISVPHEFSDVLQKAAEDITEDELIQIGELQIGKPSDQLLYSAIREKLLAMKNHPVLTLLEISTPQGEDKKLSRLIAAAEYKDNSKSTAKLVYALLNAKVQTTFHKLNLHAGMQPADIFKFFDLVFKQARELQSAFENSEKTTTSTRVPFVTVFLDEVNTSSCLGLLKEIIVDRTVDGEAIPENIFIVGACNPHRGNSLAIHETWLRGSYYVRQLHPTLQCLTWDYGSLGEQQETDYIKAKLELLNKRLSNIDLANLTSLIAKSQNLMRIYAFEQLYHTHRMSYADASACSRSCVSQRDIQRVFIFYEWLLKMYAKCKPFGEEHDYNSRAILVSLGIVYYLRLNDAFRKRYQKELDPSSVSAGLPFVKTFDEELTWYIEQVDLPEGIAKTRALKENIFANIVCTMTHTPLIIVGLPGSSKTLSFNMTLANLKGQESKRKLFRETTIFKCLDPQFYQCSRRTTSAEIDTVFSRATNRQRSHTAVNLPIYCVVFMDEAGLPEEKRESLKVLHYLLDKLEVSFVAITNHILDAAKTNRAVSLYRPDPSLEDLGTLAKGCLCENPDNPPPELRRDVDIVVDFCPVYEKNIMQDEELKKFFGLRDFIHFISYLRHNREQMLSPELIMKALERNFSGIKPQVFKRVCDSFLQTMNSSFDEVGNTGHNIFDILSSSLADRPKNMNSETDARYKLLIDPSEDGSLVRLLFSCGVLQRSKTRVYMCSEFSEDAELHKINTIAAVRLSAAEGHTVILNQTDAIHESFYDLFNRRFHRIDTESGPRFYANIAIGAHIKPCRIHPNFECIVVIKESDLGTTPPPFLNRFEKYHLSFQILLEAVLQKLPPCLSSVITTAQSKAQEFLNYIGGGASIYGLQDTTLSSLLLTILSPKIPNENQMEEVKPLPPKAVGMSQMTYLLQVLLETIQRTGHFKFPEYILSPSHLELDTKDISTYVLKDPEFSIEMSRLNTDEKVLEAVEDGIAVLQMEHKDKVAATNRACMVIALFVQWLVRHLCKRLMQMMTSEAVYVYNKKIPMSFVQCYLEHQTHFSLKNTISNGWAALEMSKKPSLCTTKWLCYTRSSPQIHQLPVQYPLPIRASVPLSSETEELMKELVCDNLNQLAILKLSKFSSYSSISEQIKTFVDSSVLKVFLLIANTQEVSKNIINHLRIMIEEAEVEAQSKAYKKLFVVLLHFPFSCLSKPCYPCTFLQGWDFLYLDVIGYNAASSVVNVREWFKEQYYSPVSSTSSISQKSISSHVEIIRKAIPRVSSHVSFGSWVNAPFNRPMSIPERAQALEGILLHKGVGKVLFERFGTYWKHSVLVEYLEKAALFAHSHETTVSVHDSLECNLKSLFFDFLTYMVSRINDELNFDLLCAKDCPPHVQELFINLLQVYPIPDFNELKTLHVQLDAKSKRSDEAAFAVPAFPFYTFVSSEIEKLVEQGRKLLSQEFYQSGHLDEPLSLLHTVDQGKIQTMKRLMDMVCKKVQEVDKSSVLGIVTQSLDQNSDLWKRYFLDFIYHQICHNQTSEIMHRVLEATLGDLEHQPVIHRLTILHVYFHVHKFHLPNIINVLRPLDSVFGVVSASFKAPTPDEDVFEKPEALSNFVMDTLFNAVVEITTGNMRDSNRDNLRLWYRAYQDVMMMSSLKQYIYKCDSIEARARHNLMHMLFLILKSKAMPNLSNDIVELGARIFLELRGKFFHSSPISGPSLEQVAVAAVEGVTKQKFEVVLAENNPQARCILEGLLDYLFAEDRTVFNDKDCQWFLELSNKQHHWQAEYLMDAVISVGQNDDLITELEHSKVATPAHLPAIHSGRQFLDGCLPFATFKFYLMRYISYCISNQEQARDTPLLVYQILNVHTLAISILRPLRAGEPGPYVPTYYQHCASIRQCEAANNKLMQQPLAHLYFITILEMLLKYNYDLPALIKTIKKIGQECEGEAASLGDKVLLYIEEQAVAQLIIRQLAKILCSKNGANVIQLVTVMGDVNEVLDDDSMGGGEVGGHRAVLALHLLMELRSFSAFTELFTTQYGQVCKDINCLKSIHTGFQTDTKASPLKKRESHVLYEELGQEFCSLYQKVYTGMYSADSQPSRAKELISLVEECSSGAMKLHLGNDHVLTVSKISCFKMAMWLCAYQEFFVKNKPSVTIVNLLKNQLSRILEPEYTNLVIHLLDHHHTKKKTDTLKSSDLLSSLFVSGQHLQSLLVFMVAMVVGCPSRTNFLWYCLFAPQELVETHIPGSLVESKIGPNTIFLDQSVELAKDGTDDQLIRRYLKYASLGGNLSLQSLYFVLWTNFAGLSMFLLAQPSAEDKIGGKIVSSAHTVWQYCASQLEALWECMLSNYGTSVEELVFLMKGCLLRWFEEAAKHPQSESGKLLTQTSVLNYEKSVHCNIFLPCLQSLKKQFMDSNPLFKNEVFDCIWQLNSRYPWISTKGALLNAILSTRDAFTPSDHLYPLSQFVLNYECLQVIGHILPGLLELYQWLHTDLAYVLTYENTKKYTIGRVAKAIAKHSGGYDDKIFEKLRDLYNNYIRLTNANSTDVNRLSVSDDTPLINLLSYTTEGEHGNDLLFSIIQHMINFHNQLLKEVLCAPSAEGRFTIQLSQFTQQCCIVGQRSSDWSLLELIHKRSHLPVAFPLNQSSHATSTFSNLPGQLATLIHLPALQEDIFSVYIAGKPFINPASITMMRMPFKFRDQPTLHLNLQDCTVGLTDIAEKLPDTFKVQLDSTCKKQLECEFHSAGYHAVMEIVVGLKTGIGHLIKAINTSSVEGLREKTLLKFLCNLYELNTISVDKVFVQVGIHSLTMSQYKHLSELNVQYLFQTLRLFANWAEDGWYNFCTLPLILKLPLSLAVEDDLQHIIHTYDRMKLQKDLKTLVDTLVHLEPGIVKAANVNPKMSLKKYLGELNIWNSQDNLLQMLPNDIFLENYVSFRVALRRLSNAVQRQLPQEDSLVTEKLHHDEVWSEFIFDLWDTKLHLRTQPYHHYTSKGAAGISGLHLQHQAVLLEDGPSSEIVRHLIQDESTQKNLLESSFRAPDHLRGLGLESSAELATLMSHPGVAKRLINANKSEANQEESNQEDQAKAYDVKHVADFLRSINLEQYAEIFTTHTVTGELLIALSDEDLKELGITNAFHRFKITFCFQREVSSHKVKCSPEMVSKILDRDPEARKLSSILLHNGVDGEMLLKCGDKEEVLKELGITSKFYYKKISTLVKSFLANQ